MTFDNKTPSHFPPFFTAAIPAVQTGFITQAQGWTNFFIALKQFVCFKKQTNTKMIRNYLEVL